MSSGSGTVTSSVEPTSFSQRSPSSPPLPRWCSRSSTPLQPTLLFCRLQSSLAEVLDRVHKVTERIPRIALFGSVLAGLDDPQSDLDILCFFPDGKDVDPKYREFCLHVAFGAVGQHFTCTDSIECSSVKDFWHKYTVGLTVLGTKVDVCVDWAPGKCHEHVVLGQALQDFVSGKSPQVKAAWLGLLSQSREAGITQRRGGRKMSER